MEKDMDGKIHPMIEASLMDQSDTDQMDPAVVKVGLWRRLWLTLNENALLMFTVLGVVCGFVVGFALRTVSMADSAYMWLGLPGDLFMRAIYCTILPLIVSSVIAGTASTDSRTNGRMYAVTCIYISCVNSIGILVGISMYYMVSPAHFVSFANNNNTHIMSRDMTRLETEDIIADLIRNLVPNNIVSACFEKVQTTFVEERFVNEKNVSIGKVNKTIGTANGTNILGMIIVSALVGLASTKIEQPNGIFIEFFKTVAAIFIYIMKWVVWLTPVGVFSLIASAVVKIERIDDTFASFGMFVLTVLLQNLIMFFIVGPLIYVLCRRSSPVLFLKSIIRPVIAGTSAPSSIIAIPDLLTAAETKLKINADISRFAISFGVALCRLGSAAFIISSVLYLHHLENIEVRAVQVFYASVLVFLGTLALPSVPSGSIVCILIILSSLNFTTRNIGILMSMEWLLDRARTMSNINAMLLSTVVVERFTK